MRERGDFIRMRAKTGEGPIDNRPQDGILPHVYRFKRAESEDEFEQIFRLNHDVFAGELGQYSTRESARLVDKFHPKNQYIIALDGERVVGMVAWHSEPPFSVAEKLEDASVLDS